MAEISLLQLVQTSIVSQAPIMLEDEHWKNDDSPSHLKISRGRDEKFVQIAKKKKRLDGKPE